MRYSLHEIDNHRVVTTTVAADHDEALEWFSEKLRLMLTFEGDPVAADYLLEEWPESLPYRAHTSNPTIPVFVVSAVAAHPQASRGVRCSQTGAESAASRDNIRIGFSTVTIGGKLYIR
jgi:hypothetical protein